MTDDFTTYDRILRYLQHDMGPDERRAFEAEMNTNRALQEEVAIQRDLLFTLAGEEIYAFQQEVTGVVKELERRDGGITKKWLGFGALGLFLGIGVGLMVWSAQEPPVRIESQKDTRGSTSSHVVLKRSEVPDTTHLHTKGKHSSRGSTLHNSGKQTDVNPLHAKEPAKEEIEAPKVHEQEVIDSSETTETTEVHVQLKEDEQKEVPTKKVADDPCDGLTWVGAVQVQPAGADTDNGKITVDLATVSGGAGDYVFRIDSQQEFGRSVIFDDLEEGTYHVEVEDKNGCRGKIADAIVKRTLCRFEYDRAFSPDYGGYWTIPVSANHGGDMLILSKTGKEVFATRFDTGDDPQWDGRNGSGEIVTPGLYQGIISYENGSQCTASVTIQR